MSTENLNIYRGNKHAGEKILAMFAALDLESLEPQTEQLENLPVLERVVFYGSSASGKSTIERVVRSASSEDPLIADNVSVPNRIITRSLRPDDVDIDHCTEEEFASMVAEGGVGMHGIKVMEGGRQEPFGLSQPKDGKLPVLFANNVVVKYPELIGPPGFFNGALLVTVYTPDAIREQRLRARSPQMFVERPHEAAFRLSAEESADRMRAPAHVIINNYGSNMQRTGKDVVDFVRELVR